VALNSEDLGVQYCRESWPTRYQESDSREIFLTQRGESLHCVASPNAIVFTKAHFLTRATSQLAVSVVPVVVHHPDHRTSGSLDSCMLGGSHVQICPTRTKKKVVEMRGALPRRVFSCRNPRLRVP
jgi:hypothetical protein